MKEISILFVRYPDRASKFLTKYFNQKYTHCSIGLGPNPDIYYSFSVKGFSCETMAKYNRVGIGKVKILKIKVTNSIYTFIEKKIEEFKNNKDSYSYTIAGVVFCILHIPFRFKKSYFCSSFVAELLDISKAIKLKKKAYRYLPYELLQELSCNDLVNV